MWAVEIIFLIMAISLRKVEKYSNSIVYEIMRKDKRNFIVK